MATAQPDPVTAVDPTPQPVMTVEWWKATVLSATLVAVSILTAFGTWVPTQEQITAVTGAGAAIVAIVFPLIAYFVHNRVTPVVTANKAIAAAKASVAPVAASGPDPATTAADEAFMADRRAKRAEADAQLLGGQQVNPKAPTPTVTADTSPPAVPVSVPPQ